MVRCPYTEKCCFKSIFGECDILNDVHFKDHECHFRKLSPSGKNQYDLKKKEEEKEEKW